MIPSAVRPSKGIVAVSLQRCTSGWEIEKPTFGKPCHSTQLIASVAQIDKIKPYRHKTILCLLSVYKRIIEEVLKHNEK